MTTDEHQTELSARYHEHLDKATDEITRLQDSGTITAAEAERLRQRETALRYQVRQLRSAAEKARFDLESGLELAWSEFQRALNCYTK